MALTTRLTEILRTTFSVAFTAKLARILRAVLPVLVGIISTLAYTRTLNKSCDDLSFFRCIFETVTWSNKGQLTARKNPDRAMDSEREFTVVNQGDVELQIFQASPCNVHNWGDDRLGKREYISPGAKRMFRLSEPGCRIAECCFDMKVLYKDRTQRTAERVDTCKVGEWKVSNK